MSPTPHPTPLLLCSWTSSTPEPTVAARTALRQALGGLDLGCETIDDAVLAVSELVANASAYATGPYELRMRRTDAEVICEVQDADPRIPDIPHPPSAAPFVAKQEDCGGGLEALQVALTERGRGLQIVDYLSGGCWGFRRTPPEGKVAWVAIPVP